MILPAILYGIDSDTQDILFDALKDISIASDTPFRVQMITDDITEAVAAIREERDISLIILGIAPQEADKQRLSIRLGKMAIQQNRDHYVVYLLNTKDELEQVLPLCARCSGILICPPVKKAIDQIFKPLFDDYHTLYANKESKEGRWIHLKSSGKLHRILIDDVCLVQAVNKTIEFKTPKQTITVYSTMEAVEKLLGDSFIRCHRSYFVNRDKIQYIDFREMVIHMIDGSQALLSRSFKESISSSLM